MSGLGKGITDVFCVNSQSPSSGRGPDPAAEPAGDTSDQRLHWSVRNDRSRLRPARSLRLLRLPSGQYV